jgi:prevent-host-death family protein
MPVIAQRELRNQVSSVLRRAERGERFTITVGGRPVAELLPLSNFKKAAPPGRLAAVLGETPVDNEWASELRALREEDVRAARDTWTD